MKVPKYGAFCGPNFPLFWPNTEIYSVYPRVQFEYGKIRTRKNSVLRHFSCSVFFHGVCQQWPLRCSICCIINRISQKVSSKTYGETVTKKKSQMCQKPGYFKISRLIFKRYLGTYNVFWNSLFWLSCGVCFVYR